jgi:hypothetical protein
MEFYARSSDMSFRATAFEDMAAGRIPDASFDAIELRAAHAGDELEVAGEELPARGRHCGVEGVSGRCGELADLPRLPGMVCLRMNGSSDSRHF